MAELVPTPVPLISDIIEAHLQPSDSPYWQVATSENTRKAYKTDIRHFIASGGLLPATTEGLLRYLNQQADKLALSQVLA